MTTRRNSLRPIAVSVVIAMLSVAGGAILSRASAASSVIAPTTLSATPAYVGQSYQATLTFTAGTTWSVISGALPPGLVLTNGRIGGTPSEPGAYSFVIGAQNSTGSAALETYTIFVRPVAATGYDTRVNAIIRDFYDRPYPALTGCMDYRGYLNYATAALWLNENAVDANNKLAAVRISHVTGQNCDGSLDPARSNLWLSYLVRPFGLFAPSSRVFPGRMTQAAADNLVAQMWAYAAPYSKLALATGPWRINDSENHDAQAKSFDLLAAQTFKNRTDYRNKVYADGSTPLQQYQKWREHWSNYFDDRAKRGLFVEAGSPAYHGYTLQAILNIYNFAEDDALRKKAGMFLDLDFADFAQQQLRNVWGGAKSRSYPADSYDGRGDAMTNFANLLFGPSAPVRNNHILMLATSGYYPPPVIRTLAIDPVGKASFEYTSRRPGVASSSGWDSNKDWHIDPTRSVVTYTFSTPDYILGTAELNPANEHIAPSNQNRWQGIIFNTDSGARVYPQAAPTSVSATQDAFLSVQEKTVLITRKRGYTTQPTLVYFPASLDAVNEQSGWLFVKEGSAYLAVRPATGTYAWLTSAKNKAASVDSRFVRLSSVSSPIIFEAARTSQYATFDAFKADIVNNPRTYANGVLNYTASIGTKFVFADNGSTPTVNGAPINYSPPNVFDSPFMTSAWASGKITVSKGSQSATYDFSDPANPTKVVH
jgi:hypothetical protein